MKEYKKILIIRNDHIGDLILSTAVFRELKEAFPKSKITVIVNKINKPIIEKNKNIDEIIELDMAEYTLKSIWNYFKMSQKIKKVKFDEGIDLRGSIMNTFFLLWLSGIKKRISRIDLHPVIKSLLTNPIEIPLESHVTEDNIKIINEGFGINSKDKNLEIIADNEDKKEVEEFIKNNNLKKFVCLFPLASLPEKQWPIENWEKLIKRFDKKYQILLFGTKKEEKELERLSRLNKNCKIFMNFDLRKLSLLLQKSNLFISHDGGPMHVAWVSKAKLIELHNLFLFGMNKVVPLGKESHVIYTKTRDMSGISLKDVEKKIKTVLN